MGSIPRQGTGPLNPIGNLSAPFQNQLTPPLPRPRPERPTPSLGQTGDQNATQSRATHPGAANLVNFGNRNGPVTRETLIQGILSDTGPGGLAEAYNDPRKRAKFEEVADLCLTVGQRENVDPRILFAMAMQESDCGLNTRHSSSAQGVTGMKPSSAPDASARRNLSNIETCLTQTARYLKGQLVRELSNRGYEVSAADVAPGANNSGTQLLLLSYRYGSGGLNQQLTRLNREDKMAALAQFAPTSDYANVFRHMSDMGL